MFFFAEKAFQINFCGKPHGSSACFMHQRKLGGDLHVITLFMSLYEYYVPPDTPARPLCVLTHVAVLLILPSLAGPLSMHVSQPQLSVFTYPV